MATEMPRLIRYTVWISSPSTCTDWVWKIGGKGWAKTPNSHLHRAWKKIDRPIVTMMTEMIGSPISGRSTTTWRAMPKTSMNAKVIPMPTRNGSW